jgi:hypothetical protein
MMRGARLENESGRTVYSDDEDGEGDMEAGAWEVGREEMRRYGFT